ncbi:MAG: hypothetical protein ABSC51_05805 [Gaiellaceae bacterium]|jgi:hypothetical protein
MSASEPETRQLGTAPPKLVIVYEYERAPYIGFAPNLPREEWKYHIDAVARWLQDAHPEHAELLLRIVELLANE